MRQYPGARLAPGGKLQCMEAVYGVARPGEAHKSFVAYVRSRMRRVLRGHDKPYAVLESFGGQPGGNYWTTAKYLLEHLGKVAQSLREGGPQFDIYAIEFWHDTAGDLTTFHRKNFPNGFQKVRDEILRLGMKPGLWIDSGGQPEWTIRDNPAIRASFTGGNGRGALCRASEPINSMYKKAFIHHIRENQVRLLKFDNLGWPVVLRQPGARASARSVVLGRGDPQRDHRLPAGAGRGVPRGFRDPVLGLPQPVVAPARRHVL